MADRPYESACIPADADSLTRSNRDKKGTKKQGWAYLPRDNTLL